MVITKLKELYEKGEETIIEYYNEDEYELIIKNYKELCKILEDPELEGNSKKAQQKEWKRYFDYRKEGQKYIIYEIYKKPLPKNIYENPMVSLSELLICEKIIEHIENPKYEDNRYVVGMTTLAKDLGYINELFKKGYEDPEELKKEIYGEVEITRSIKEKGKLLPEYNIGNKYRLQQLKEKVFDDCYYIIPKRYKYNIEKAINNLKKSGRIGKEEIYYGVFIEIDKENPIIEYKKEKNGEVKYIEKYKTKKTFRPLTGEEVNLYQSLNNELLKKYNCKNVAELYKTNNIKRYYKEIKEELLKRYRIESVTLCYALSFANDYIYERREDEKEKQKELNKLFLDKSLKNSLKMKEKRMKKILEKCKTEEDRKLFERYYTKEQQYRDEVLIYLLSL